MNTSQEPSFIPLCVPEIRGNEWKYLQECLDTNFVSSVGPFVDRFEREVAAYVGTRHAVATVNGTAALHVALLVAGVRTDDEVLVSTLTFIAPVNAIRYVGALPVFIDAEPEYWQMDVEKVAEFLIDGCRLEGEKLVNKTTGRRVKAILPVHILGHPVDMDPILELARRFSLTVIEDATESLGARYKDRAVGHLSDIACFSFNGNKIITTGGGGMIVTDNGAWASKAKYLTTQAKNDPVEYIHDEIGFNYRLTNIQAALGCAQLEQLDSYVARKRAIAALYEEHLRAVPGLALMRQAPWAQSIFWMYTVLVDEKRFGCDSRALLKRLAEHHIQTRPLWRPVHMNKPYRLKSGDSLPISESLYRSALSLPSSVGLKDEDLGRVVREIVSLRCSP